jgi:hypothetical protein
VDRAEGVRPYSAVFRPNSLVGDEAPPPFMKIPILASRNLDKGNRVRLLCAAAGEVA